jgi:hypothetical protein
MATINKSLTTYLPSQSVEWLESYCLDYKHLQNKEGNPKLGTAVADIIARLADGELTLPDKIEHQGTAPIQYGTELETLKGEVDELKKLIAEYGTNKLPNAVLDLEAVRNEIERALEPIKESVSKLEAVASRAAETPATIASTPASPRQDNQKADSFPDWVRKDDRHFYRLLADNSELLDKVAEVVDLSVNSTVLAASLFELGLYAIGKKDKIKKALDLSSVSRIKYVVSHLKTAPESALPLFPAT